MRMLTLLGGHGGDSKSTLRRAKAKLGVTAFRYPDRTWLWSLTLEPCGKEGSGE